MFIANHIFLLESEFLHILTTKRINFTPTITITSIIMPTFTSHLKYDSTMEIIFYFCINLIKSICELKVST